MRQFVSFASAIACIVTLAGCGREPTGQVVAVVGDDEVTLQEINAEIGNAQLPKGINPKAVQQMALQRIIDRRLLADVARDQKLDAKPEFLIRNRQLVDALLVQQLGQQAGRSIRVPDAAALEKYVADHPATFAQREIYNLDQIRFPMPADSSKVRALEDDHSMDSVATKLRQLGIEFERGTANLDTAALGQPLFARLQALPAGEPFIIPENGMVSVSAIVARKPAPLTGLAARPVAVQLIRNEELSKLLRQRLEGKKTSTKIEYQPGFGPSATTAPAPGVAAH